MEIWKDIPNLKGYQVSNIGRIKSLKFKNEKILKYFVNEIGYPTINLYEGTKRKQYRVHRLVAQAFIDNPNNYPCINHKNEIKTDNRVENLEWCTIGYNNVYGTRLKNVAKSKGIPVICLETGEEFDSAKAAADKMGLHRTGISNCCKGIYKTSGRLHWRFKKN